MSFGALNINVTLQISNKILFEESFGDALSDDPLQICLTYFGLDFDIDRSFDEVNALLNSSPPIDTNKWNSIIKQPVPSGKKLKASSKSPLEFKLKLLLGTLENAFLRDENTLLVIISSPLNDKKKSKVLSILREYKEALRWTI